MLAPLALASEPPPSPPHLNSKYVPPSQRIIGSYKNLSAQSDQTQTIRRVTVYN